MVHDQFLQERIGCVHGIFHDNERKLEREIRGKRKAKTKDKNKKIFYTTPKGSKVCIYITKNEKQK